MKLSSFLQAFSLILATTIDCAAAKKTIGLALNGGSGPAGNAVAGFMRGFQQQKLTIDGEERSALEAFTYLSGLSAGNVPIMTYHYAEHTTSDELLDAAGNSDPTKITMEDLEVTPEKSLFNVYVTPVTPFLVASIFFDMIFQSPALWPLVVSFHMLSPYGIATGTRMVDAKIRDEVKSTPICSTVMTGPEETFHNYEYDTMSRGILTELYEEDKKNSSVPPIDEMDNGFLLELTEKHNYQLPFPAYFTHEGLEIPFSAEGVVMKFDNVVNATAEDVNLTVPITASYAELSSDSDPFTVEKVLGMGTDLLLIYGQNSDLWGALPESVANPILVDIPTAVGDKRSMVFTDGGYIEGLGIPPLVAKKTDHIISVINSNQKIPNNVYELPKFAQDQYSKYFGFNNDIWKIPYRFDSFLLAHGPFNHIFEMTDENGESNLVKIYNAFKSLFEAGEPMITTLKNVKVIDNPFYGIEGGWTLDLTIIFGQGVPEKFAEQIPEGIVTPPPGRNVTEYGYFTNENFRTVPNVAANLAGFKNVSIPIPFTDETFDFAIPDLGQDLPQKEARMTTILNSWIIGHAWDGLTGADGEVKFEGFGKIFEGGDADDSVIDKNGGDNEPSTIEDLEAQVLALKVAVIVLGCIIGIIFGWFLYLKMTKKDHHRVQGA